MKQVFRPATFLKKKLWHRHFRVNFAKFLRTPFSQNTSGGLLLYKVYIFGFLNKLSNMLQRKSVLMK